MKSGSNTFLAILLGVFVIAPLLGWVVLRHMLPHTTIAEYQECVAQLQAANLVHDSEINIPKKFSYLAKQGVFVTPRPQGQWILFKTWSGKGSNTEGYLYTNGERLGVNTEVEVNNRFAGQQRVSTVKVQYECTNSWYVVYWGED